ncbi:MAG: hypothetical protein COA81_11620 [Alphaproteobacteria bacterium]|nr:MAG: hypothetical protein COA81_11620 [Alphaproteobacteria bacterium]
MKKPEYKDLFIAEIDCEGRLRGLSPAHVEVLAHSIEEHGQQTPVLVRKNGSGQGFKLMAGAHRIKAMLSVERQIVSAKIYSNISDTEARLIEIDENLFRHELNALDRAVFLAERKAIYEEMYPETKAGVAGGKATKSTNEMFSFVEETAKKLGLSGRSIERAVRIATKISPEMRKRLSDAGYIKEGELYNLSQQKQDIHGQIIDLILAPDSGLNVKSAADQITGKQKNSPDDTYKQYHKLMDVWSRTETKAQKLFLEFLKGQPS